MKNKILAVIPARGGSKGIPNKNLKKIDGKTLVKMAIEVCKSVNYIDDIFVSTDSKKIRNEAERQKIFVPQLRPDYLSGDSVGDIDVLINAIEIMEDYKKIRYKYVLMIQPTSPLRIPLDLKRCIKKIKTENLDTVWTVSKVDTKYHPYKQLIINSGLSLELFSENGKDIIARQQLKNTFIRNGLCYVFSRDFLLTKKTIYGENHGAIVTNCEAISIDTPQDLDKVKKIILSKQARKGFIY